MHVIVIGAGIIGMTTAYYLKKKGHKVSIIDAGEGPGLATSKANGAQLSYSFVAPLADPAVLPKLPSWLLGRNSPLSFRLRADPAQWRWSMAFLSACRYSKSQRTTAELLQLGLRSRELMHDLVAREDLSFDFKSSGKLLVYQDPVSYAAALLQVDYQATLGCEQTALDRQACLDLEPALEDMYSRIAGGIFTRTEDAGDCMQLCSELERVLRSGPAAVEFQFNTSVKGFRKAAGEIVCLDTAAGDLQGDAYVIANGIGAQALARQANINPLIYPLKGYSLTYELTAASSAPAVSVSDVHNKVVYARLGNRLRVAGMVDIGDTTGAVNPARIAALEHEARAYFPRMNPAAPAIAWAGLRPARPDGKPLIGATPYRNLWINAGHGALGFTLATGSAALLADQMSGVKAEHSERVFGLGSFN